MKLIKYFFVLCALTLGFVACDDDDDNKELPDGGSQVEKVGVAFGETGRTVLRNSSKVQIPIVLEKAAEAMVRVNVAPVVSDKDTVAEEGIDFNVSEKVINIPAGETTGYLEIDVLDPGKVTKDMTVDIEIKGVYGAGKKAETNQTFRLAITSNAFVEFEKAVWTTYESAATNEEYGATCRVPLKVSGELREAATVEIAVADSTAKEYEHFELVSKKITIQPGEETVYVELIPKDDKEVNYDRIFSLSLLSVDGSNLTIGKTKAVCEVTIVSEEKMKTLSFKEIALTMDEGETKIFEVNIDYAPVEGEDPVTVILAQRSGNAELNVHYTLSASTLTFNAGEKVKYVKLTFQNDEDVVSRDFVIELKSPTGASLSKERSTLSVVVKNDDYPSFASASYTNVEASGINTIPVNIPGVLEHDVTLQIETKALTAVEGTHYELSSETVTIPAGETTANISFNVGYSLVWQEAAFEIVVKGAEERAYDKEIKTTISLIQCKYRQLLGDWSFKIGSYDGNGKRQSNLVRDMSFEVKEFNKTFTVKTEFLLDWGTKTFTVEYDPSTGNAKWLNNEPIYTGVNFSGTVIDCYLRTAVQQDQYWSAFKYAMPLVWDESNKTFTWDISEKFGLRSDCRRTGTDEDVNGSILWFIFKDLSMTKK